jgi:hypothetical protein
MSLEMRSSFVLDYRAVIVVGARFVCRFTRLRSPEAVLNSGGLDDYRGRLSLSAPGDAGAIALATPGN